MIKKSVVLIFSIFVSSVCQLYAEHRLMKNTSNITMGTLDNRRLNPSSVTLQGNSLQFPDSSLSTVSFNASTVAIVSRADTNAFSTTTLKRDIKGELNEK